MTAEPARMLRPPQTDAGTPSRLKRLRADAADFARHWSHARPAMRSENRRVVGAMATLGACAAIVATGAFYDVAGVKWATTLSPQTVAIFAQITRLGDSGYVFALTILTLLAALWMRGAGGRRDVAFGLLAGRACYLFTVAAASGLVSQLLKHLFGRARPKLIDIVGPLHFDAFSISATYASFPSGHAVTAFAMATGLAYVAPKTRWPLLIVAVLVAASRVIIGAHYLSDVCAGAALGFGSAVAVRRMFATRRIVFEWRGERVVLRGENRVRPILQAGVAR